MTSRKRVRRELLVWIAATVAAFAIGIGCAQTPSNGGGDIGPPQLNPAQEQAALRLAGGTVAWGIKRFKPEIMPHAVTFCAAYTAVQNPERLHALIQAGLEDLAEVEDIGPLLPMVRDVLVLTLGVDPASADGIIAAPGLLPDLDAEVLGRMKHAVDGFCLVATAF